MTLVALTLVLLAAPPSCSGHMLPKQRPDAASVRQVDSAYEAAYERADTAFVRCLLTADYRGYTLDGVEADRATEVSRVARHGPPDAPLEPYPPVTIEVHGTSASVGMLIATKRLINVYRYENGAWRQFLSIDVKLPPRSS